jgi:hypothetical protein
MGTDKLHIQDIEGYHMSWRTEWQAISLQIQGLVESTKIYVQTAAHKGGNDYHGIVKNRLIPQTQWVYETIKKFVKVHNKSIPLTANTCIEYFIRDFDDTLNKKLSSHSNAGHEIAFRLSLLASLQSELTYHLSDFSAVAKRISERAFMHLRRSIVADQSVKQRWGEAFEKGEVACEKLGSSHLLLHGIWAFKVSGSGGCTDLVFSENHIDLTEAESVSEALVLTEWKVVKKESEWNGAS